jgi:hypothetical protein
VAKEVVAVLADPKQHRDYWWKATYAEAMLLLGHWQAAVDAYDRAFREHPAETGSYITTRTQIRRLLEVLPIPEAYVDSLRTPPAED